MDKALYIAVPLLATLMAGSAAAQVKTGQFAVRAQVVAECQVTPTDLNFNTYASSTASSASTPLKVRCTPNQAVTISLSAGSSNNAQARTMTGATPLSYQLYRDAAHNDPINTTGMAWQLSNAANTGQEVTYTIYGMIPANQNVAAGPYIDQITVTVQY